MGLALSLTAFLAILFAGHLDLPVGRMIPAGDPVARGVTGPSSVTSQARAFMGIPAVGALFTTNGKHGLLGRHFCTASVVDSPHHDLVLTAAHCVSGIRSTKIVFVPGYNNGQKPYGEWAVTRVIVDHEWISSANPDDDFAFLVVAGPGIARVQDVTGGGMKVDTSRPRTQFVRVIGYPDRAGLPISCKNRTRWFSASQIEFDCGGYTDGTSGSPLIAGMNTITGLGTVIGVIGGFEQGGYTPDLSYAAKFGPKIAALFKIAIAES